MFGVKKILSTVKKICENSFKSTNTILSMALTTLILTSNCNIISADELISNHPYKK